MARWIIRSLLRAAREKAGMKQGVAAHRLDWSPSKIQRIEAGEVNVSGTDLTAMLNLYGVGRDTEPLIALARFARKCDGPWNHATTDAHNAAEVGADGVVWRHLDGYTHDLIQFEFDARLIRWCESGWLPDMLHTDRYAAARLDHLAADWSDAQCAAYAEVSRLCRDLFHGKAWHGTRWRRPRLQVVLDEAVVHRPYGGYPVLAQQIEMLLDHVRAGRVELCIVGFASANPLAAEDPFALIDVDVDHCCPAWQLDKATVLALHSQQRLTTDPPLLDGYRRRWDKLWAAYDPASTELTLRRRLNTISTT